MRHEARRTNTRSPNAGNHSAHGGRTRARGRLPNATFANAKLVAERILSLLRQKDWKFGDPNIKLAVTISIGAAALAEGDTPKKLFERADASLYNSKKSGKDRVSLDLIRKPAAPVTAAAE